MIFKVLPALKVYILTRKPQKGEQHSRKPSIPGSKTPQTMHKSPFLLNWYLIQMLHLKVWKMLSAQAPPPIWFIRSREEGEPVPSSVWGPAQQRLVHDFLGNQLSSSAAFPPPAHVWWVWTVGSSTVTSPCCHPILLGRQIGPIILEDNLAKSIKI